MLTTDLLSVRVGRTHVRPRYVARSDEAHLELARTLIGVFERNVSSRRRDLDEELADVLGTGTAFTLHRGLAKLLEDRCEFDTRAVADPVEMRRAVFEEAADAYRDPDSGGLRRDAVLTVVGERFGIDADTVERSLYADLKDEQVLTKFERCSPEWLLDRYNVALAQGVLLRASSLVVSIRETRATRYRELFRKIKFFRLLHEVEGDARSGFEIRLNGPMSVLRSSQRYGLQMAMFLPSLLHCEGWRLEATVAWGKARAEKLFELSAEDGLSPHTEARGQFRPEELGWFVQQFEKLDSRWSVSTEAEVVDLGGQGVLIPDFAFTEEGTGRRAYLEVLGFWNRGSVASRLELLRRRGPANLILGVSKELHLDAEALEDLPGGVYVFRSAPIAREVARLLEALPE